MPQLNPSPWFAILMFSWFVFLIILPPKVMSHSFPNNPAFHGVAHAMEAPWGWPWF